MNEGSKGLSIAALIMGILSMLCCCIGFPFAIVGIILAVIVLVKGKNGKGLAIAGLITSGITLVISIIAAVSIIPVMPYMEGWIEFGSNAESYMEEYDEYGTYPPVIDQMIEDGIIPEDQAQQVMDQIKSSMPGISESND